MQSCDDASEEDEAVKTNNGPPDTEEPDVDYDEDGLIVDEQLSSSTQESSSAPQPEEHATGFDKLYSTFKEALRKKVDVTKSTVTSQRRENAVPLFLSETPELRFETDVEAEGFHLSRDEINKLYSASNSDVIIDDAFISASEDVMQEIVSSATCEYQEEEQDRLNSLGILGAAGTGKTTLAEMLMRKASERTSDGRSSVVFLIAVGVLNFKEEMSLLQFLTSYLLPEWSCSDAESWQLMEVLITDPNILIILDGLDACESKILISGATSVNENSHATPGVFIQNILNGRLLPLARRVFTSRPSHVVDLHPSYAPQKTVNIQGMTMTAQELLGRKLCWKKFDKCRSALYRNHDLQSFCHVPYLCNLILCHLKATNDTKAHVTMTQVLAYALHRLLDTGSSRKQFNITKLARMSLKAVKKGRVDFRKKDFRKFKLDKSVVGRFLGSDSEPEILKIGKNQSHFANVVWLDFFSALYLMMCCSVREFKNELKDVFEMNLTRVISFAFGIAEPSTFRPLLPLFPKASSHDCDRKLSLLARRAVGLMADERDKSALMQACRWAHESNSDSVRLAVREALPEVVDLSELSLLPWELTQLVGILQVESTHELEVLDLTGNKIGDRGTTLLVHCFPYFREVKLERCGIGRDGAREISGGLVCLKQPMQKLTLSGNRIGDIGVSFVAENIHGVRELEMIDCGIELNGVNELSSKILHLKDPMKRLDLSWNHLTDAGATSLSHCIHKLMKLEVACCGFSPAGRNLIKKRLRRLNLQIFRVAFEKGAIELRLSHNNEPQDSEI